MAYRDPKQAVIDFLSSPPQPYAQVMRAQQSIAKGATIQFLKKRRIAHHQLFAVSFENEAGQRQICFCLVHQDSSGLWQSGDIMFSGEGEKEKDTGYPYIILSGGGKDPWSANGNVIDNGFDVTQVRLISPDGQVVEDQVEHGLVLFLSEQEMQRPVEAELYNRSNVLVGKHIAFPAIPPEWENILDHLLTHIAIKLNAARPRQNQPGVVRCM